MRLYANAQEALFGTGKSIFGQVKAQAGRGGAAGTRTQDPGIMSQPCGGLSSVGLCRMMTFPQARAFSNVG